MNDAKFQHWFDTKLTTGGLPYRVNTEFDPKKYDVVINVSDEYYIDGALPEEAHWFAMTEHKKDMGVNAIYQCIVVLQLAEEQRYSVYLHCHKGFNRSRTVRAAYYYFRTGRHWEDATPDQHLNRLLRNCFQGQLPPIREMEKFLGQLRDELKTGMKAGICTLAKVNTLKNF